MSIDRRVGGRRGGAGLAVYTRKVAGLIPGQVTYLGLRFDPWSGHT